MKNLYKRILSIFIIACIFVGIVSFDTLASNRSTSNYHYYNLAKYVLPEGYCTEIVDDTLYAYLVENGEAFILNIQTNMFGPDKTDLILPTMLGGYPVTSIGTPNDNRYIFEYLSYTDSLYPEGYDEATGFGYSECDPGLAYVSRIIIPEGYKNIYSGAFLMCVNLAFSFPKSLETMQGTIFDELYTDAPGQLGNQCVVLPDCKYYDCTSLSYIRPIFIDGSNDAVVLPSRDVDFSLSLTETISSENYSFYLPSNLSVDKLKNVLFYEYYGNNGKEWYSNYNCATYHCAPDSEFLSLFEEYGPHKYATIITDVTPAEYIQFPDETVNVHVGDVVGLEAKTYPTDAIWTACDYEVSDPSVVKIDEYSGRITALKEGTVTVTATHCERGYVDTCTVNVVPEPVPGVNEVKPATDTPYYSYGNRDYSIDVTGSPSKIQVVRDNGVTTTIDRRRAKVTSHGDTETWVVNMRVEAGTHNIRAKYGNKWDERYTPFTVTYDVPPTPKAYSFDLTRKNGVGTFEVVTDPQIIKIRFQLDNGCTLTYSQGISYIGEDGLRHWTVNRNIPANTRYTLKIKLGYTWTTTELTAIS